MKSFFLLLVLLTAVAPVAQSQTGAWLPAQSLPAYPRTLLTADSLPAVRASLHRGVNGTLYRALYANSQGPAPTDNTSASGRRARATFAKNAAFLLLLDRQPTADSLVAWPVAARAAYLSQTVQVLETLNSTVEPFASLGGAALTLSGSGALRS